ncbi:response regulator [Sulfuriflexus mobilis]|uniref:response regulator n=1 Tax=Sulfuriflexus mobilis TaxID=1811807 RepID=UPI000F819CDB|nr:response regulator [Sulfuriflexus mobilis]
MSANRILVAEDNPVNQKVVIGMLSKLGYNADIAHNGAEVLEAMARNDYAIIFMDCLMPVMDGYEATRSIRASESEHKSEHIYIVALTANAMSGDQEKCLAAGMDDYIPKPLSINTIKQVLEKYLPD